MSVNDPEAINALWALAKMNYKSEADSVHSDPLLQVLICRIEDILPSANRLDIGNMMAAFGMLEVSMLESSQCYLVTVNNHDV